MTRSSLHHQVGPVRRRGFSLIELLLAIFILGVGVVAIAAVFPAGIIQQRRAQDDVLGPVVAEGALSLLRSKLSQDDFGTFEEFEIFVPELQSWTTSGTTPTFRNMDILDVATSFGDWPWLRPSMNARSDSGLLDPRVRTPHGDIDIFSSRYMRTVLNLGQSTEDTPETRWATEDNTTELLVNNGTIKGRFYDSTGNPGAQLAGIPFNRRRFGFGIGEVEPRVTITQEERCWPAGSGFETVPALDPNDPDVFPPKPQYVWDCMFRRFQGKVQVAIFVYRVIPGGGGTYRTTQDNELGSPTPPLPARLDLPLRAALGGYDPLTPEGDEFLGPEFVPDTSPNSNPDSLLLDPVWGGWQSPGQWLVDPTGRIHRVVQGRRNGAQGPVRLARPIPAQAPTSVVVNPQLVGSQDEWAEKASEVRSLWFIPPADRVGVSLEPVYVTVREL